MSFERNLHTMRAIRRLTQVKLAKTASTTARIIIDLEAGRVLPTPELKERLKEALNWTELADEAFAILGREPA